MRQNIWIWNHYRDELCSLPRVGEAHYWFAENLMKQMYLPNDIL
jgi:hypothetical protein